MTIIIQSSQGQELKELECLDNKERQQEAVFFIFSTTHEIRL